MDIGFPDCANQYNISFTDPSDNLREILQNVAKLQGVSNMRKLGHLNNFTKVSIMLTAFGYNK